MMFGKGLAFAIAILATVFSVSPAVAQSDFASLVVFGDSYLDSGNTFARQGVPTTERGNFEGRSMNGYNYADLLSLALFGTPATASDLGGTNFAIGSAKVIGTNALYPDLAKQMTWYDQYLAAQGKTVDPNALYILGFGTNDTYINANATKAATLLQNAAHQYALSVKSLADRGATTILVANSPGLIGSADYAQLFNHDLAAELNALLLPAGTRLLQFDYATFLNDLAADPTRYGLSSSLNTTGTCLAANALDTQCAGYLKFDGAHPTAAVHQAIYQSINEQFGLVQAAPPVPEPGEWALLLGGLVTIAFALKRRVSVKQRMPIGHLATA